LDSISPAPTRRAIATHQLSDTLLPWDQRDRKHLMSAAIYHCGVGCDTTSGRYVEFSATCLAVGAVSDFGHLLTAGDALSSYAG